MCIRDSNKSLDNNISNCIHAGYFKQGGRDQQYIKVDDKYYLSDKVVKRIEDNLKEKDKENNNYQIRTHYLGGRKGDNKKGGTGHLCKTDDTSYCLDTANSQAIEVIKLNTPEKVFKAYKKAYERKDGKNSILVEYGDYYNEK